MFAVPMSQVSKKFGTQSVYTSTRQTFIASFEEGGHTCEGLPTFSHTLLLGYDSFHTHKAAGR